MVDAAPDTYIALSADEKYFPLAKGLILSLLDAGILGADLRLAFLDIGCAPASLAWLAERQVTVRTPDENIMGALAASSFGYHRAQTCRPFLPELFPGARIYIWIDCDAWVQSAEAIHDLRSAATSQLGSIALCPECHYSYKPINDNVAARISELFVRYEPLYGAQIAGAMAQRTMLNSGVFALAGASPLWNDWKMAVTDHYTRTYAQHTSSILHFAEQMSLNVLLAGAHEAVLLDPIYNYVCLWTLPIVDEREVVRVSLAPYRKIGIVHLAGGWRKFGDIYFRHKLLYKGGRYLTAADQLTLFSDGVSNQPATGYR